jgi:hypothetical protein
MYERAPIYPRFSKLGGVLSGNGNFTRLLAPAGFAGVFNSTLLTERFAAQSAVSQAMRSGSRRHFPEWHSPFSSGFALCPFPIKDFT